ncbi:MAG: PAS domain S-box protein [Bacteroidota bacterium]
MESKLNKLLTRQLKKHFGSVDNMPEELKGIILDINNTYENFKDDTALLQNSIEISSLELRNAFQKQKQDAEDQKLTINSIKEAILAIQPASQHTISEPETSVSGTSYLFESLIKLIEARKTAEEEILKLSKAVEQNPASIVITDIYGNIEYVNPKFYNLTGYTREEVIGKNPRILKSDATPSDYFKNLWETILSGKEWSGELQNKKKNGEIYWESALISPIFNEHHKITHFVAIKEDITERKYIDAERIRQSGLITSLLDSIPDIIFFKDIQGVYLGCNPPFVEFVGKPKNEIIGKTDYDLFDQETATIFRQFDNEMLALKLSRHNEEWITYPDGRKILIDTLKTPYWASDGSLIGILGISRDITKRKEAEDKLLQSSQKWEAIISASPDGIGVVSLDGKLQLLSEKLATMYGYTIEQKDEYLGKTIFDYIDPSNHQLLKDNIRLLIDAESENKITEYLAIKKDNSRFYVDVNSCVLYDTDGNPESILFVERDITERKQAKETLENERTLFRTIIDLIPDAVYVKDTEGRKIIANPKEVELIGKNSENEIIGNTDFNLLTKHQAEYSQGEDQFVLTTGNPLLDIESTMHDRDGIQHWLMGSKVALRDIHGNITGIVGITHDISDLKKTEAGLVNAKLEAEMANQSKSIFLANMSHEIRTPLNAIIGFSQLMNRDPLLTATQKEYNTSIIRAGEHLLMLINDILELSKVEAGRVVINPTNVDLYELIDDIQMLFKERVEFKQLQLLVEVSSDLPRYVWVDEQKLRQIFFNLIGNAIKFTDQGGIAVRVRSDERKKNERQLIVEVQDSGHGIAEDELNMLFQHFAQTASGIKKSSGTGLGLALSRELAILMGGNITVKSQLGKGSVFTFYIAIKEGEAKTQKNLVAKRVTGIYNPQKTYRILVVDDKEENLKVAVKLLQLVGFETAEVMNGKAAVEKFKEWQPDLVLMDIRMPEMDGLEACRLIKLTEKGKETPIIALTASSFEEERKKIESLGMLDFIRKPFRENDFFTSIGNALAIEYIYEKETASVQHKILKDQTAIEEAIANLPNYLISQMADALSIADLDLLIVLIKSIAVENPELSQHLTTHANDYDYAYLQQLLKQHKGSN